MNTSDSRSFRFPTLAVFVTASAVVAVGVWRFLNIFERGAEMPSRQLFLFWLSVLVCAPLISAGCAARLFREKGRPHWLPPLATVLAVIQLFVWALAVFLVLYALTGTRSNKRAGGDGGIPRQLHAGGAWPAAPHHERYP